MPNYCENVRGKWFGSSNCNRSFLRRYSKPSDVPTQMPPSSVCLILYIMPCVRPSALQHSPLNRIITTSDLEFTPSFLYKFRTWNRMVFTLTLSWSAANL